MHVCGVGRSLLHFWGVKLNATFLCESVLIIRCSLQTYLAVLADNLLHYPLNHFLLCDPRWKSHTVRAVYSTLFFFFIFIDYKYKIKCLESCMELWGCCAILCLNLYNTAGEGSVRMTHRGKIIGKKSGGNSLHFPLTCRVQQPGKKGTWGVLSFLTQDVSFERAAVVFLALFFFVSCRRNRRMESVTFRNPL